MLALTFATVVLVQAALGRDVLGTREPPLRHGPSGRSHPGR
jgi:hypothetical protein